MHKQFIEFVTKRSDENPNNIYYKLNKRPSIANSDKL